jgi:hypothetical protein
MDPELCQGLLKEQVERNKGLTKELEAIKKQFQYKKEALEELKTLEKKRGKFLSKAPDRTLKDVEAMAKKYGFDLEISYQDGVYCPRSGTETASPHLARLTVRNGVVTTEYLTDRFGKKKWVPAVKFPY